MNLKIILNAANSGIRPALKALERALPPLNAELYCLGASEYEVGELKSEYNINKKSGTLSSISFLAQHDFNSPAELANHHFLNDNSSGHVLFLSSDILLEKDSLKYMIERMESDNQIAGVNPFLLADWISAPEKRIAFMGLTFDYQKKLHFLYEGILAENDLAKRERFFQIGHPDCLLLRCDDFRKAGGFRSDLGFLAFPALCLQILKFRAGGYACIPEAQGRLKDKFNSWSFCGAWSSILQRGRLETSEIDADYARFCRDDGIKYNIDSWLAEGPLEIPDASDTPSVKCWQEWSYHPKPTNLLSFLSTLPVEERIPGLELARNRPSSLPQTLQYYKVQAEKIKALAKETDLPVAAQIDLWRKKIRRFHYGELRPGIELLKNAGIYNCALDICPAIFDAWAETTENFEKLEVSETWPEIAVVMPVWNPKPDFLRQAIESVVNQTYPNWQLRIADDASTKSEIRPLLESFANGNERIKVKFRETNGHICRATNTALEMVDSPFMAFLDHDDLLSPHALGEVARRISQKPDLGFIYSDEDRINEENVRRTPVFKPDFDRDLFYTGHLSAYDTKLIRELGGLRIGTEGSQDQDLRFRVTERLDYSRIAHIPRILYHWRVHEESSAGSFLAKPYALESGRKVYLEAAERQGRKAEWGDKSARRLFRLLYYPQKRPLCSVILLVDDLPPSERLIDAVRGLEKYADLEVQIQPLRRDSPKITSLTSLAPVEGGIARACNEALVQTNGDIALFLSASLEPDRDCRLEQLLELAMMPHISMASGNVWFNGRLASGGWYPDADGAPFQLLQGMDRKYVTNSVWGQMLLPRHVAGAPWECMVIKRREGRTGKLFNEDFGSLATVDFALRAMRQNRFVAMNPWVNWRTRAMPPAPTEAEMKYLIDRWGAEIAACGLRNPNLRSAPDKDWTIIL